MSIEQLKQHLDGLQRQADSINAEYNFLQNEIKKEFDCDSIDEAREYLDVLRNEEMESSDEESKMKNKIVEKMRRNGLIYGNQ